jgi:glycosidase
MPDLNLRNPDVTAEIERIATEWLDDFGVDGFRLDAAQHLIEDDGAHQANTPETYQWLADFSSEVHASHPGALILSEVYAIAKTSASYVPKSSDLSFDFGLASAMVSALGSGRAAPIATALGETIKYWPPNGEASFLTNHDQNRVITQLNGDLASAKLAAGMLLTAPGVPFVYYGEEIGMQGSKPDERLRTPMQWSADAPAGGFSTAAPWESLADDWQTVNVAAQDGDAASLLSTYRSAIGYRKAHGALSNGATFLVEGGAPSVIGWLRATSDDLVLTVFNVGAKAVSDYGLSLGKGPLCGVTSAVVAGSIGEPASTQATAPEVTSKGGLAGYQPIATLGAKSGYVIELQRAP